MNITPGNGDPPDVFDLEQEHEKELVPLINELCERAQKIGAPIFVTVCYKSDTKGSWLASSARVRKDFIPQEFHFMRAVIEGRAQLVNIDELIKGSE